MSFPKEYRYTKDHEWVAAAGNELSVGVTTYAIEQLGDIVHIELPSVGETFDSGASFGTIESTKTVSDLYMPVGGTIKAINEDAIANPESLQDDPHAKGWLVKIESSSDMSDLMDAPAYEAFIQEQA